MAEGIRRNPRHVDSRFILILVDVLTVLAVSDGNDDDDDDGDLEERARLMAIAIDC